MTITENLRTIQGRIQQAAVKANRNPALVKLVAVSKMQDAAAVDAAAQAGQPVFGENYVQELVAKTGQVRQPVSWHFIGALQSNKVRQIAGLVELIHSVDRLSLAREIDRQWGKLGSVCEILIQVNIAQESTKSGSTTAGLLSLVREISVLPHVQVKGLMTMPPFFDDPEGTRPFFRQLRILAEQITAEGIPGVAMQELSMGMSGDFEVAIEEGATLVRVGSAIFGERHYG